MFSDPIIGAIRTYTPIVVGIALTWAAEATGFVIDEASSSTVLLVAGGLATAAYWTLVRLIASKVPVVGILLGYNKKPTYNEASPQTTTNIVGNES